MITLDGVPLPDLFFENEFAWTGVRSEIVRAKAGNVIAFEDPIQGREIDLNGDIEGAWMDHAEITNVQALATVPGKTYELNLHGVLFTVRFRHEDAPVFSATPTAGRRPTDPQSTQTYNNIKIKLMEV